MSLERRKYRSPDAAKDVSLFIKIGIRRYRVAYAFVIIWLASNLWSLYLAKKKHIEVTLILKLIGGILGPFVIPFLFWAKPR